MIYFIRHAQSSYNAVRRQLVARLGPGYEIHPHYLATKFNIFLEDPKITRKGFQQCWDCGEVMADKHIGIVVTTPLRRAIMTSHEIFKNHKDSPQVVVDPDFREILESACDIGSLLRQSKKDYPHFDYSLIEDDDAWYVHTLRHLEYKQRILDKLEGVPSHHRNLKAKEATLEVLREAWHQKLKNKEKMEHQMMTCIEVQRDKLLKLAEKHKSVAVISHRTNLERFTGVVSKNCQVSEMRVEDLEKINFAVPAAELLTIRIF